MTASNRNIASNVAPNSRALVPGGWINWNIKRSRLSANRVNAEMRRISWRRAISGAKGRQERKLRNRAVQREQHGKAFDGRRAADREGRPHPQD